MATAQDLRDASLEGAAQRVRPVMMTVAAIIGGVIADHVDDRHGGRRHETDCCTDDRRNGEFNDPDASGDSRTLCPLGWLESCLSEGGIPVKCAPMIGALKDCVD